MKIIGDKKMYRGLKRKLYWIGGTILVVGGLAIGANRLANYTSGKVGYPNVRFTTIPIQIFPDDNVNAVKKRIGNRVHSRLVGSIIPEPILKAANEKNEERASEKNLEEIIETAREAGVPLSIEIYVPHVRSLDGE